ncbi:MAG: RagB/SusD family nutrient uptake outer membrane protein [Bacteroidales bacterium]|jgi:hypothetical protein|nr:RagB/SusD family nutrient uptake outer membrane protein [Phocaeicola sp.]MCH3940160.1 RagB/SusD family nutrient uptake outer membrane protein [Bacteroidales bacterium]MDD7089282.1 RagB/SusD family nutrient uptake outer membrane protein [Bacteroidales bacterium]
MKKAITLSFTTILFFCASCDSTFLDRESLSEISEESVWKTADDAIQAINSLYYTNRQFYNSISYLGFLDDFTDISYQSWANGMTTGSYPTNAGLFSDTWTTFYRGIYRANTALQKLPSMKIDDSIKQRCLGEAYFFRGYFYFKLCDLFGGVPIYDTPMSISEAYKPRNTEQSVYDFVVADMTKAIDLLPESYGDSDKGRATKWAAYSMRGKAYLWAKEYSSAATDFKTVMDKSDRSLYPDYYTVFHIEGNNCSEIIFDVQYIEQSGQGLGVNLTWGNQSGVISGQQRCRPTNELVNAFEMIDGSEFSFSNFTNASGRQFDPNNPEDWSDSASVAKLFADRDPRLQKAIIVPWSRYVGKGDNTYIYRWPISKKADQLKLVWTGGSYAWRKFVPTGTANALYGNVPQNFPLIRLADVILMYAEAENEANSSPSNNVYDAINAVRARAGMPNLPTGLNQAQMRERIRHERMVELCGEGKRYSDLRRWKIAKDVIDKLWMRNFTGTQIRQRGFPDNFYLWAIPQSEIDLNPKLEQNPGWSE